MAFDLRQLWVTEWIVCGFFLYLIVLSRGIAFVSL